MLIKFMNRNIPVSLLSIIENWLNKSLTCVRWGTYIFSLFPNFTGVRQGGVLSPTLFAISINNLIVNITSHDAVVNYRIFASIFLYFDDIILLSPSVGNLQLHCY